MRIKSLVKKFSYNQLVLEAEEQEWIIPLASELKDKEIEYDWVWVADQPIRPEDEGSHGYLYNVAKDEKVLVNRNNIYHVAVIVKPKKCKNCGEQI